CFAQSLSLSLHFPPLSPIHVSCLQGYGDLRDLHSFPTRRSSDLEILKLQAIAKASGIIGRLIIQSIKVMLMLFIAFYLSMALGRSEEHTSELQSRFDLVCRLLLEKKK